MRTGLIVGALLLAPAVASAQDELERKAQELKRQYEQQRAEIEKQFRAQLEKMEAEFQERMAQLRREIEQRRRDGEKREHERRDTPFGDQAIRRVAEAIEQLHTRVERLERMFHERRGNEPRPETCPCKGKCEHCHPLDRRPEERKPERRKPEDDRRY